VFRRRRKPSDDEVAAEEAAALEEAQDGAADDGQGGGGVVGGAGGVRADRGVRADGPWDVSEVDAGAVEGRIDLGGLWLQGRDGLELQAQYDEATGTVGTVTLVIAGSALQVQPFAAPRTTGIWDEVRKELAASITAQGGVATEQDGSLGVELSARVPVVLPDGSSGAQLARFVGVDGPRWFLRGVITGQAAGDEEAAAEVEQVFRGLVVVRGSVPMGPREPIPLRLPVDAAPEPEPQPDGRDPLDPFQRGPEITEVR
jgi:hypothetical protein